MATTKEAKGKAPVKLRAKTLKDERQSLLLDIYVHGQRTSKSLGLYLIPEDDAKAIKKNEGTLKKAEKALRKKTRELMPQVKVSKRTQELIDNAPKPLTLLGWLEQYTEVQRRRGRRDLGSIANLGHKLEQFRPHILLKEVDKNFCADFVVFLSGECKTKEGNPLSSKYRFNLLGELGTALYAAVREGLIPVNPLSLLSPHEKVKVREKAREYLTIEEVKQLIDTPCENEAVKKAFLFACNCGLRLGDVEKLTWGDVTRGKGVWQVGVVMSKTEHTTYIPLGEQARRWMPKYKRGLGADDRVFSLPPRHALNEALKKWIADAGISKDVIFYTSRHSYATILITLGVDLYTVSKLLGHSSIRHTQRYARIVDQKKDEAVNLIDQYFNND